MGKDGVLLNSYRAVVSPTLGHYLNSYHEVSAVFLSVSVKIFTDLFFAGHLSIIFLVKSWYFILIMFIV